MKKFLKELIEELNDKDVSGRQDIEVMGVVCDSRKVEKGSLFVCVSGFNFDGRNFNVMTPLGKTNIHLQLSGKHNIYNALAAIGVGISAGINLDKIREAIAKLENIPGRFEQIDCGQPFSVIVDYAHTPDALGAVLKTARGLTRSKVLVVFGCGGDRDKAKRPLMGEVAATHSDIIILTSDNPRNEDPIEDYKRN